MKIVLGNSVNHPTLDVQDDVLSPNQHLCALEVDEVMAALLSSALEKLSETEMRALASIAQMFFCSGHMSKDEAVPFT